MENKIKIAFLGTPEFAVKILEEMKKEGFTPSLIITAPDAKKGRGMKLSPPPVKEWAYKEKIKTIQPDRIINAKENLQKENFDLFVLAAYGQIIPNDILKIPKHGIINTHPSLLPRHRGASPIQSAILEGDEEIGTTIMLLDNEMDHGPIISQEKLGIKHEDMDFNEIEEALAKLSGKLISKIIKPWISGEIKPKEQEHKKATYTKKIKKEDTFVDFKKENTISAYKKIRAFSPKPGAYFFAEKNGRPLRIIITKARLEGDKLKIEKVKPEGKSEMDFKSFIKGNPEISLPF